ncbi:hypothetical protein AADZ90_001075 [Aestuariibius sp. 2305UL40-4]|uniref:hypothetical protein n=1 Tax=Aestuariibius violaceus TaxID=3234132 RepID=UPI00345E72E6
MTPRRTRLSRGAALTEVLAAAAIVAMIGTLILVATGPGDRTRLDREVAAISVLLAQARLMAAETGRPVELVWTPDDRQLAAGPLTHRLSRNVDGPDATQRTILQPNGESDGLELTLVAGPHRRTVILNWLTGRSEVAG